MSSSVKILLVFLLAVGISYSQSLQLHGTVTDAFSGKPIRNAIVYINYAHIDYTNNDGHYSILNLIPGNYKVKASYIGYKPVYLDASLTADTSINFSLEPSPIELNEIIVKTNRFDKFMRSSPYPEVSISGSQIENKPYQSLPDVLKTESGVSMIREGIWGTEVNIHGLSRESVVALIDGNRIATSTDVAARFSLVDMNDIERVEIVKGASSTMYGSGATGGIVNIITRSPSFANSFGVTGNISSGFNSVNNSSITSGSLYGSSSIWAAKITGSYRKAGDVQTPVGTMQNSQFEDYGLSGTFNMAPVQNQLLKLDYQLFKANNVGIPGASVFPANADVRYPTEKRQLLSANYEIRNISSLIYSLSLKYSYQFIERDVENIPHTVQNIAASGTTPAKRVTVLKITPNADHKNNNLQLYGNLLLNENNNLLVGIDYWDRYYNGERRKYQLIEAINGQGNVINTTNKIIGEKPLPDSKYRSLGVFVQDDADIIKDKLLFSLSARLDKISISGETTPNTLYEIINGVINYAPAGQKTIWNKTDNNDYSYSANAGLKYSLTDKVDLTASLGLSFRSPSLEERFQYIDQGSYVRVGNPELNSEKGKSADLGIKYYIPNFKIISSFFYNYFNDLVVEVPGTFENRPAYIKTNIGKSRIYGFDVNSEYNFLNDFVSYITAAYVIGNDITSDGNLAQIPPFNTTIGLRFALFNQLEADLSSDIFAAQNKTAAGELKTPGYAVVNLLLNTKMIDISSIDFRICAGIENLLNKNYRNHLSALRGNILTEPGRNFYIKLITSF